MTLAVWLGFLLAAILIAVTPGPGAVISMSTGMRHGYLAALTAILGLQAAILLHLMIVALGLGALLAASETAFALVKFVGAAYLVWLGIQKWRAAPVPVDVNAPQGFVSAGAAGQSDQSQGHHIHWRPCSPVHRSSKGAGWAISDNRLDALSDRHACHVVLRPGCCEAGALVA